MTQIAAPRTPESWGLITNLGSHGREEAGGLSDRSRAPQVCASALSAQPRVQFSSLNGCLHEVWRWQEDRSSLLRFEPFPAAQTPHASLATAFSLTMDTRSQRPKKRKVAISSLNAAIEAVNRAEMISTITPIKAVLGSVSVLLTVVRVCFLPICIDMPQVHT